MPSQDEQLFSSDGCRKAVATSRTALPSARLHSAESSSKVMVNVPALWGPIAAALQYVNNRIYSVDAKVKSQCRRQVTLQLIFLNYQNIFRLRCIVGPSDPEERKSSGPRNLVNSLLRSHASQATSD